MIESKKPWVLIGLAATALLASASALAQDDYPSKPITMIVPFPPGGVADIAARPVAEAMGRYLNQPIVIENKAGAGGGIGMSQVAKAKPDGYTVLMALASIVVLPEADTILQRKPMFELKQLRPVARFTADPVVLVVQADSPWKDFKQFTAALRQKPGGYTFGSSGNYGTMHVPFEQLKAATNTSMLHIPYTGAGPAVVALLGGQVDAVATGPSTVARSDPGRQVAGIGAMGRRPHSDAARCAKPEGAWCTRDLLAMDRCFRACIDAGCCRREIARGREVRCERRTRSPVVAIRRNLHPVS